MTIEVILKMWPVILTAVGVIVWLVRLEGKSLANEKEVRSLWKQRNEDIEAHLRARSETNAMLHEMRDDIKRLLERPSK